MKVLILEGGAGNEFGGAEQSMFSFIQFLKKNNVSVYLAYEEAGDWLSHQEKNEIFIKKIEVNASSFTSQGVFNFLKESLKLKEFIKSNEIDILLTHTIHSFPYLFIVKILTQIRFVIYFKWLYNKKSIGFINKISGSYAFDRIILIPSLKNYWKKNLNFYRNEIYELNDGINISTENHKLEKKGKEKNILYLGRIYEGKGLHVLIEVLEKLKSPYNLIICGKFVLENDHDDIEYHKKIHALITKKKLTERVRFKGFISDVQKEILNSDLVIVPSVIFDAQPRVILESLLCKKMVLASNIGGSTRMLSPFENILTFKPSINDLYHKILNLESLKKEEANRIMEFLHNKCLKEYSDNLTNKKLLEHLKNEKSFID